MPGPSSSQYAPGASSYAPRVHDRHVDDRPHELHVRVTADDEIDPERREVRRDPLLGCPLREDVHVVLRRRMAEEHAPEAFDLELERRRQRVEERDLLRAQLCAHPVEHLRGSEAALALRQLAVGVAAQPVHPVAELAQALERPRRVRPGGDVPAHDDLRVVRHLGEHRLERGQVAVHVVESRDPQPTI